MPVVLRGPAHSTLLRAARLALEEKGVAYALREADLPRAEDRRPGRAARHRPWDAPVLEHDGFTLSETAAITRYVDEAFPGPALQPADARERARMAQIVALADHHLHGPPAMRLLWRAMYGAEAANGGPLAEVAADEDRPPGGARPRPRGGADRPRRPPRGRRVRPRRLPPDPGARPACADR